MLKLILRHAWLNLWDKHMTTGRINQVSHTLTTIIDFYISDHGKGFPNGVWLIGAPWIPLRIQRIPTSFRLHDEDQTIHYRKQCLAITIVCTIHSYTVSQPDRLIHASLCDNSSFTMCTNTNFVHKLLPPQMWLRSFKEERCFDT